MISIQFCWSIELNFIILNNVYPMELFARWVETMRKVFGKSINISEHITIWEINVGVCLFCVMHVLNAWKLMKRFKKLNGKSRVLPCCRHNQPDPHRCHSRVWIYRAENKANFYAPHWKPQCTNHQIWNYLGSRCSQPLQTSEMKFYLELQFSMDFV